MRWFLLLKCSKTVASSSTSRSTCQALLLITRNQTALCCPSRTIRLRQSFIITRTLSRRLVSTKTTRQRPGLKFLKQPRRSSRAAHLPVASLRPGSPGFRPKILLPGTTFPTAPMKTASAAPMSNSRSTNLFSLSTSRLLLTSPRMVPSVTAAVHLKQSSFSLPANARC
ncbi:hypothetical protein D9M69_611330 [compost metagenome]